MSKSKGEGGFPEMRELFSAPVKGDGILGDAAMPKDGDRVTAMTFESVEYDTPPERKAGTLKTREVPGLGYTQYWVDGVQVDPATVRPA